MSEPTYKVGEGVWVGPYQKHEKQIDTLKCENEKLRHEIENLKKDIVYGEECELGMGKAARPLNTMVTTVFFVI